MTPLERNLIWLGYEDHTPLPQFVIEVDGALAVARQVLTGLLARGWTELYRTEGTLASDTMTQIPAGDRQSVLDDDSSWSWQEDDERIWTLVWYATTAEGYDAYRAG